MPCPSAGRDPASKRWLPDTCGADGGMKIYAVGGAVRDELLGLEVKGPGLGRRRRSTGGHDYARLRPSAATSGVLHPNRTRNTPWRARSARPRPVMPDLPFPPLPMSRSEQDLMRRDLTINAIARDESGQPIDPMEVAPTSSPMCCAMSPAFAGTRAHPARYFRGTFCRTSPSRRETMVPDARMVDAGEVDAMVAERVWQNSRAGLMRQGHRVCPKFLR